MTTNLEKTSTPPDLETYKFQVLTALEATERRALQIAESTTKIRNARLNWRPIDDPYFSSTEYLERRRVLLDLINGGTPVFEALKQLENPDQI